MLISCLEHTPEVLREHEMAALKSVPAAECFQAMSPKMKYRYYPHVGSWPTYILGKVLFEVESKTMVENLRRQAGTLKLVPNYTEKL